MLLYQVVCRLLLFNHYYQFISCAILQQIDMIVIHCIGEGYIINIFFKGVQIMEYIMTYDIVLFLL